VPDSLSPPALATIILSVASLVGIYVLVRTGGLGKLARSSRILLITATAACSALSVGVIVDLVRDGEDPFPAVFHLPDTTERSTIPDPSQTGRYQVERLSYGAGENLRRPEFGARRDLNSRTVDAAALLPEWKGLKERMRERYWGFGLSDAPLNGLVWAPVGDGPFPIALIVHGNHGMEDFSDAGYAYLGELLASRGILTVSVDENFINGTWSGDFQGKEMPLRAWLLLEHLKLWREWNTATGHTFFGRVDMQNVALLGHSRGGEAVSIAFAYNTLSHYPDDATVEFDYGFRIRSLVAIAQVDQRYHRRVKLENVNFLTLHGSYDSDEPAYHGIRQLNRIELNDDNYWVKSGVYIHGANHGQFNTGWGRTDFSPPGSWLLNLAPIIDGEIQRQAAKTYISAFLAATLQGDQRYLALLKDPRAGAEWLPDLPYVNQYTDSTFFPIANFEEDLDVTTGSLPAASIRSSHLGTWREEDLEHRDKRKQGSNVVIVGWNSESNGQAMYAIESDNSMVSPQLDQGSYLAFSVSGSTEKAPPAEDDADERPAENGGDEEHPSPSFTVELVDQHGNAAAVATIDHLDLAPPMRVRYMKNEELNKQNYESDWEAVLQHAEVPLSLFVQSNVALDLAAISQIRFRFDRQSEGVVILDNIGFLGNHATTETKEPIREETGN
jgi:dienelactone hydrolase